MSVIAGVLKQITVMTQGRGARKTNLLWCDFDRASSL